MMPASRKAVLAEVARESFIAGLKPSGMDVILQSGLFLKVKRCVEGSPVGYMFRLFSRGKFKSDI